MCETLWRYATFALMLCIIFFILAHWGCGKVEHECLLLFFSYLSDRRLVVLRPGGVLTLGKVEMVGPSEGGVAIIFCVLSQVASEKSKCKKVAKFGDRGVWSPEGWSGVGVTGRLVKGGRERCSGPRPGHVPTESG